MSCSNCSTAVRSAGLSMRSCEPGTKVRQGLSQTLDNCKRTKEQKNKRTTEQQNNRTKEQKNEDSISKHAMARGPEFGPWVARETHLQELVQLRRRLVLLRLQESIVDTVGMVRTVGMVGVAGMASMVSTVGHGDLWPACSVWPVWSV